jgi:hypothetical protein
MPGMLAGSGCPVWMTQPLLDLGRLLVADDRPLMGGQLSALGQSHPLTSTDRALLALLGPGRGVVTVVLVHGRLRSFEQVGRDYRSPSMATSGRLGKYASPLMDDELPQRASWTGQ